MGSVLFSLICLAALEMGCSDSRKGSQPEDIPLPKRSDLGPDATAEGGGVPVSPSQLDGGGDSDVGARPGCNGVLDCERVVFATSAQVRGSDIGGLAGGDAFCQHAADSANADARIHNRGFLAWLSTAGTAVPARLPHGTKPYVVVERTGLGLVANDWADLLDGQLHAGIGADETGAPVTGIAWTGTNINGTSSSNACGEWNNPALAGQAGNVGGTGNGWTDKGTAACANAFRLYCVEF